jgi:hypothetical protein
MAEVIEIFGQFVKGKRTRGGRPVHREPEAVVTLVATGAIDDFLGARSAYERTEHLRRLRDEGLLIHDSDHRLTQKVAGQGVKRAYAFRARADDVPRIPAARPRPEKTQRRDQPGRGSVGIVQNF